VIKANVTIFGLSTRLNIKIGQNLYAVFIHRFQYYLSQVVLKPAFIIPEISVYTCWFSLV